MEIVTETVYYTTPDGRMFCDREAAQKHMVSPPNPIQYEFAEKGCECVSPRLIECFFPGADVATNTNGVVLEGCLECGGIWFKRYTEEKDEKPIGISLTTMFCTSDGFMFPSQDNSKEHLRLEEQLKQKYGVDHVYRQLYQLTRYNGDTPQRSPSFIASSVP